MKKIISVFLIVVMALGIVPFAVNAEELTADVVYGTPDAIDGVLDDGWNNANTYESDKHYSSNPTEISATWKVMYDSTNLYFFVTVKDSTIGSEDYEKCPYPGLGDLWTKNTVQIYLDLGNEKTAGYDTNAFYIDINARGYVFCHYIKASQFVKAATVVSSTGYTVEVAVDLGVYSDFKAEKGTKFGLDVWASDNLCDNNGRADFVSWTGKENVYSNTDLMGTATLGEKPANAAKYNGVIKGTNLKNVDGATLTGITNAVGGNMNNVNISTFIVDGNKSEGHTADCWQSTYSDDTGVWFGVEFDKEYEVSQVIFWEGGHWNDGGWFGSSPVLEVYSDGEWKSVDFTLTPSYPSDDRAEQADINESYIFNLNTAVECSKIRVRGAKNSFAGHASVSQIEVFVKTQVDTPDTTPETTPDTTPVTTPDTTPVTNPKTGNALSAMFIVTVVALFGTAVTVVTAKRKF